MKIRNASGRCFMQVGLRSQPPGFDCPCLGEHFAVGERMKMVSGIAFSPIYAVLSALCTGRSSKFLSSDQLRRSCDSYGRALYSPKKTGTKGGARYRGADRGRHPDFSCITVNINTIQVATVRRSGPPNLGRLTALRPFGYDTGNSWGRAGMTSCQLSTLSVMWARQAPPCFLDTEFSPNLESVDFLQPKVN